MAHDRTSKYITDVRQIMQQAGHATNHDILERLRETYPELSATTVHRITARMVERGELRMAPAGNDNAMRFDVTLEPHDHFICERCGLIRDAHVQSVLRPAIEQAIGDNCSISGNLTVSGMCKQCKKEKL